MIPADVAPHWTGATRAVLDAAVRRHGGWESWQALRAVVVRPKALSGMLPWLKGYRRTFELPPRAEVRPHEGKAIFFDYPAPGAKAIFAAGTLLLEDGGAATPVRDARASFRGMRKWRRWSPADALYFFGYALTHYHGLPFTLVDGRPLRCRRARGDGRTLTAVDVELPAELHTHCRRQTFYFDDSGLLRRHDYVAEIVGPWARGAHFWRDFVEVAGLQMACVRHVVARVGRRTTPFVALHAELALEPG